MKFEPGPFNSEPCPFNSLAALIPCKRTIQIQNMTNHEMLVAAMSSYGGEILTTADIKRIVCQTFPQFSNGSILPNDHATGNKSACWCAGTESRIFQKIGRSEYRVLPEYESVQLHYLSKCQGEIMSKIITRPAALVTQGKLKLYTTSLRVSDLLLEGFYSIERLDPENPSDRGYQRLLNKARAKKLADYLIEGQESQDAFLPTSVFLATDKHIPFDSNTNTITFDVEKVGPLSVVDGQHRIEGLKLAAEKNPDIMSFEVPVNIAIDLPNIDQMCHFLIVNTTQKSVDKAVEQRIYARLTQAIGIEEVPNLPKWIRRIVETGDDEQALRLVDYLNEKTDSPWFEKIEMAMQTSKKATISQKSFVKAIKKYVLTANNPISVLNSEQQNKIFLNYWKSLAHLLDVGEPTVLFKYNGAELFCRFSTVVFNKLTPDYRISSIEKLLTSTFEQADGEYAGVGHPDWWLSSTGVAGSLNPGALGKVHHELVKALHKVGGDSEIKI